MVLCLRSENNIQYSVLHWTLLSNCAYFLDAVFRESTEPRTAAAKQKRAKQTFDEMMSYIPGLFSSVIFTLRVDFCFL